MTSLFRAHLVLETGEVFSGWTEKETQEDKEAQTVQTVPKENTSKNPWDTAGEVVFNTSHSGYEEIATDPSYYSQILVMTAPIQGNYGSHLEFFESNRFWIKAFVCLEMNDLFCEEEELLKKAHSTHSPLSWKKRLMKKGVPFLTQVDTRQLVIRLREKGTNYGALVREDKVEKARKRAQILILEAKKKDLNWPHQVCSKKKERFSGDIKDGPKLAVLDFGCKKNILREMKKMSREITVFPYWVSEKELRKYNPDGLLLSNGPGDPAHIPSSTVETIRSLLGWRFIFGICMGHQILSLALGGKTYKLPFGHRGSNHPVKDLFLSQIYVTSQNHGYAVEKDSLDSSVQITHVNLNDQSVAGIYSKEKKCMGIQFHPESSPGTHDAKHLFQFFSKQLNEKRKKPKQKRELSFDF